ncbi:hypothetical protein ACFQS2_13645 [Brachybacterium sp. GCM10030267]|uniref:hypothetical protein n=1 Tax=Brachybacterium sp. GCM10030267 TaxID=3273381 RepID=UPI00360DFC0A
MSTTVTFAAMRWRIIRTGPNDERAFGLVAGLLAAVAVIVLAVLAQGGDVHPSWVTAAISLVGLTWLIGPVLLPGSAPVLDPQWFRTLPRRPVQIAREMAPSEAISVGTVITAVTLVSMVILVAPLGPLTMLHAAVAAMAQLFFLLWLGRCAAALVSRLLRSRVGMWVAAVQMSVLLAISFAGWVPVVALFLPRLGEGDSEIVTPAAPGAMPAPLENTLLALPTGWGLAAVRAVTSGDGTVPVPGAVLPLIGLVIIGLVLCRTWIALTAYTISRPPARIQNAVRAPDSAARTGLRAGGPVRGVADRELATWFRDPHRKLGLGHAWITPVLMIALVAPTSWSWALPFIGVMAAVFGAMVAVNTYALDGTALWQLLTTPGAVRADVLGRQAAWMVLFGLPIVALTIVLCLISQSPLWAPALGMTLAATGAACAGAPLFAALMPAVGADARDRVSTSDDSGNAAGGEWTVFVAVVAAAIIPVVIGGLAGAGWLVHLLLGAGVGAAAVAGLTRITRALLDRSGPAMLSAFSSGDATRLRKS